MVLGNGAFMGSCPFPKNPKTDFHVLALLSVQKTQSLWLDVTANRVNEKEGKKKTKKAWMKERVCSGECLQWFAFQTPNGLLSSR